MSSKPKTPDYAALAQQQYELNKKASEENTLLNRPNQKGIFGSVNWTTDPATGRPIQTETLDPRVQGIVDKSLQQQGKMGGVTDALLAAQGKYKNVPGAHLYAGKTPQIGAFNPNAGNVYGQRTAQTLLARMLPQQTEDKRQMELKLRLQGLEPGTEAYNRAYQNLLTSQGDVNAQAQLQGWLAGQGQARENYNTRLNSAMNIAANRRAQYETLMQGQNQINAQNQQKYLMPWNTAQATQSLTQGSFTPYMPTYQGYGTAQSAAAPNMMGAAQQQYMQNMANYNASQERRAQLYNTIGNLASSYFNSGNSGGGSSGSNAYFS